MIIAKFRGSDSPSICYTVESANGCVTAVEEDFADRLVGEKDIFASMTPTDARKLGRALLEAADDAEQTGSKRSEGARLGRRVSGPKPIIAKALEATKQRVASLHRLPLKPPGR